MCRKREKWIDLEGMNPRLVFLPFPILSTLSKHGKTFSWIIKILFQFIRKFSFIRYKESWIKKFRLTSCLLFAYSLSLSPPLSSSLFLFSSKVWKISGWNFFKLWTTTIFIVSKREFLVENRLESSEWIKRNLFNNFWNQLSLSPPLFSLLLPTFLSIFPHKFITFFILSPFTFIFPPFFCLLSSFFSLPFIFQSQQVVDSWIDWTSCCCCSQWRHSKNIYMCIYTYI